MPNVIEGTFDARGLKFAIVVARFNSFITDRLLEGAIDALTRSGCNPADIDIVKVPGSWEMPLTVRALAARKKHDAIIALGAVVRGETPHFDYVAGETASGRAAVGTDTGVPAGLHELSTTQ